MFRPQVKLISIGYENQYNLWITAEKTFVYLYFRNLNALLQTNHFHWHIVAWGTCLPLVNCFQNICDWNYVSWNARMGLLCFVLLCLYYCGWTNIFLLQIYFTGTEAIMWLCKHQCQCQWISMTKLVVTYCRKYTMTLHKHIITHPINIKCNVILFNLSTYDLGCICWLVIIFRE